MLLLVRYPRYYRQVAKNNNAMIQIGILNKPDNLSNYFFSMNFSHYVHVHKFTYGNNAQQDLIFDLKSDLLFTQSR